MKGVAAFSFWWIPQAGQIRDVLWPVLIANAASLLFPYAAIVFQDEPYTFSETLDHAPCYIIGWGFLAITILFEMPIVYLFLKNKAKSVRSLVLTIIGANIVTTVLVALFERIVTDGQWGA